LPSTSGAPQWLAAKPVIDMMAATDDLDGVVADEKVAAAAVAVAEEGMAPAGRCERAPDSGFRRWARTLLRDDSPADAIPRTED
jgi:hypothetical protein